MLGGPAGACAKLLYVEDDAAAARLVRGIAQKEGLSLRVATCAREFLKALSEDPPDLCLVDLTLPDASGLDLLKQVRAQAPAIVVTASDDVKDAVSAMKLGAADYVTKPFDPPRLSVSLRNALALGRQSREIARLREEVAREVGPESLVGSSSKMQTLRRLIRKAAASEATVLVTGENGTGKELVARALHFCSPRASRPFVDINCAALSETLLESEIFGHEQGAFTGATARRRGKFEQAQEGTLFFDEIGDMPVATQAKMLRVLQERTFQRVGGEENIDVDVRVLCASNRDLEKAVADQLFRKDLFYRVNTLVIEVPPLRERAEDIPELARHFLRRGAQREKRCIERISQEALDALARHPWPGNVRELQHAIDRAILVCEVGEIRPDDLPPAVLRRPPAPPADPGNIVAAVEHLERTMILEALEKHGWVKARAARALGLTERIISYKMVNLGLTRPPT